MPNNRPKKPTALRKRLGDPGKSKTHSMKTPTQEFGSVQGMTAQPPEHLSTEAKTLWAVVVSSAGWLVESDAPALILLCTMHDKVSEALASNSNISPATAGAIKVYMGLLDRFGLTPQSRINLGLAVAEAESRLDAFRKEAG